MSELALALTLRLFRATGIGMNYRGERPSFRAPTRSRHERVPLRGARAPEKARSRDCAAPPGGYRAMDTLGHTGRRSCLAHFEAQAG